MFKVLYPSFYRHSKKKGFVGKYSVFIDGHFDLTTDSIVACAEYIKELHDEEEDCKKIRDIFGNLR